MTLEIDIFFINLIFNHCSMTQKRIIDVLFGKRLEKKQESTQTLKMYKGQVRRTMGECGWHPYFVRCDICLFVRDRECLDRFVKKRTASIPPVTAPMRSNIRSHHVSYLTRSFWMVGGSKSP